MPPCRPAHAARKPRTAAAAVRFLAAHDGHVRTVDGAAEAARSPGVVRVHLTVAAGDWLGPLWGSGSRQGYVLATGEDTDEAVARASGALDLIRLELDR